MRNSQYSNEDNFIFACNIDKKIRHRRLKIKEQLKRRRIYIMILPVAIQFPLYCILLALA